MSIHVYVYFINLLCHTGVIRQMYQNFYAGILEGQLAWTGITPEVGSNITERYSHCACYYDKSMYIFGGCTSTNTTFNDLWRFDLKDRQWIRPLAIGSISNNRSKSFQCNQFYALHVLYFSTDLVILLF